jgi:hypothetical protein
MSMLEPQQFHKAISALLDGKLKPLWPKDDGSKTDLNLGTCVEIYTTIFEAMVEVISTSGVEVTNEGMNYLAQQYYDGILINGHQELDPNIFTQRARLDSMETEELTLLAVMLVGTDFALPILEEIKKRQ